MTAPAAAHTAIQPGIAAIRRAPVPSRLLAASGSADFAVTVKVPFLRFFAYCAMRTANGTFSIVLSEEIGVNE